MQGADEVVVVSALDHGGDTAAHLCGRLVGEGEAQDVGGVYAQHVYYVGVAVGECLGLAGPGSRNHADSALCGLYGLPLTGIQPLEDIVHVTLLVIRKPEDYIMPIRMVHTRKRSVLPTRKRREVSQGLVL